MSLAWMCLDCGEDLFFQSHKKDCVKVRVPEVRMSEEIRVIDPQTGGEKGSKIQRFSLIPSEFLWALAEHYGKGARKYADRNWERGYKWSLSVDAMERHWTQWKLGERQDPETGSSHLVAAAWHCIALFIFELRGVGSDDVRPQNSIVQRVPSGGSGGAGSVPTGQAHQAALSGMSSRAFSQGLGGDPTLR